MKISKTSLNNKKTTSCSEDRVISIGSVDFEEIEKSQYSVIPMDHLERAIRVLKNINKTEVVVRVQDNFPVLLSPGGERNSKIGVLISPRICEEDR